MPPAASPRIVIATQSIEGNLPALRLLKVCAEFGEVAVITPQSGPNTVGGISFQRIVPSREIFFRGVRVIFRKLGAFLPLRIREAVIQGFMEDALGIIHQGVNFKRAWKKHALKPELLVLDGAEYMNTAGKLARRAGAATSYYVHEMFPNQYNHYSPALTAFFCRLEREECRHAKRIIVQHRLWGKLLRRRYRLPADKFTEVTPSPEPGDPLPGSRPEEPLKLYYHGLFAKDRALDTLVRAVANVSDVQLDLRGRGDFEQDLRRVAAESGAGNRIRFLPPLPTEELSASARPYDLGVVAGSRENLSGRMAAGIKLYENMAAGIGLLGYRAVTVRNIVRRLKIGFTFDSGDVRKVTEVLRYCVQNRDEVRQARENAILAVRNEYNSSAQYERLRAVIATALNAETY